MVREKTFREDLFYRINLIQIHLPALRERKEDIPLLAQFFADRQSAQNRRPAISFTSDALELLQTLPFPGNIRELKNVIERTILVTGKSCISADDLRSQAPMQGVQGVQEMGRIMPDSHNTSQPMTLDNLEAQTIRNAIEQHNGNLSKAARALGISRTALYRRIEKYGLN